MEVYTHVEYTVGKYIVISPFVSILTAPVIKSVTLTPNPVDAGKTFIISVEVTD